MCQKIFSVVYSIILENKQTCDNIFLGKSSLWKKFLLEFQYYLFDVDNNRNFILNLTENWKIAKPEFKYILETCF
jgi:hypothetical protein